MKTVKTFTTLSDAGFAGSLLEAAGIPALLADEQSFLMLPGLATGGIRVQVEDQDFERALRVLAEGPDASAAPAPALSDTPENAGKIPVGVFVAAAVALALLYFTIHQMVEERRIARSRADVYTYESDYNHDGKPDHFYTYRNGKISKAEVDHNFDGKIDYWEFFDSEGRPEYAEADTDFNGQPDWFFFFKNGIIDHADCRPNGSQIVVRRQIYEHGVLREEWVDEDQDGKFDYKILHDPFGGMSERIPIEPPK